MELDYKRFKMIPLSVVPQFCVFRYNKRFYRKYVFTFKEEGEYNTPDIGYNHEHQNKLVVVRK